VAAAIVAAQAVVAQAVAAAALVAAAVVAAVLVAVGNYLKVVLMIQRLYFSRVKNLSEKWVLEIWNHRCRRFLLFETLPERLAAGYTDGHRWKVIVKGLFG
jgi:hypothetical protein